MEPSIEYATTVDGRRIACFAIGAGKPLLIAATPPWSHVQQEFQIPTVNSWLRDLAKHTRVVRYDCRGSGLSDRTSVDFSVEAAVRDMEAVVEHFDLRSIAILGMIGGSPAAILYASRHPARVSHMVLWAAYPRGARLIEKFPGWESFTNMLLENWQLGTDAFAQVAFGWAASDTAEAYASLTRDAMTQDAMKELIREVPLMDVSREAAELRVPTLVMARRAAASWGPAEAGSVAALIPGARLSILDGSSEAPFLEDPDSVTKAMLAFIATDVEPPASPRPAPVALSDREQQVLRLLAGGRTGKEIAQELTISLPTVQRHIANIYSKIGARGRVEAAAYAFEHGLVPRRQ